MCLAVPGKVVEVKGEEAKVDFSGVVKTVRLDLLPEVKVGDYVIVHVGYAIQKLDEEEALETLKILKEMR